SAIEQSNDRLSRRATWTSRTIMAPWHRAQWESSYREEYDEIALTAPFIDLGLSAQRSHDESGEKDGEAAHWTGQVVAPKDVRAGCPRAPFCPPRRTASEWPYLGVRSPWLGEDLVGEQLDRCAQAPVGLVPGRLWRFRRCNLIRVSRRSWA